MITYLNKEVIENNSITLSKIEKPTDDANKYIKGDGTWSKISQSDMTWGGSSLADNVSLVGAAMSDELSANRLAFMNPLGIDVSHSNDGGNTYTDAALSNDQKVNLVTLENTTNIGPAGNVTTNDRTQILLKGYDSNVGTYVYTRPKKLLLYVTTNGHTINVTVDYATGANPNSWTTYGTYPLNGWSGWNDIPLQLGTFGGYAGQSSNIWYIRLTFSVIGVSTSSTYATVHPSINSIRLYGDTSWVPASNYGKNGHLYTFDWQQNVVFPSSVKASTMETNYGFFETSDANLKNFNSDIDVDLDKIKLIPKKYFTWKDNDGKQHIGTSAQEVQKIYPELVYDSDGILTVDYAKLSVIALAAIDKLIDKQKDLEERLERLEKMIK
jgi:hypothetical protein